MGLDDLYKHKDMHRKHGGFGNISSDYNEYGNAKRRSYNRYSNRNNIYYFLNKIWAYKKLRVVFIVITLLIFLLVTFLLISIIPLLIQLFDFIIQNGIQGLMDKALELIEKLWKGTGN